MVTATAPAQLASFWTEEQADVLHFSLVSNGFRGLGWLNRFGDSDFSLSNNARAIISSPVFKPIPGVLYDICLFRGGSLHFRHIRRITKNIGAYAKSHMCLNPPLELACIMRQEIADSHIRKMGLRAIVIMHRVKVAEKPCLLRIHSHKGASWLDTAADNPDHEWPEDYGFAYLEGISSCWKR